MTPPPAVFAVESVIDRPVATALEVGVSGGVHDPGSGGSEAFEGIVGASPSLQEGEFERVGPSRARKVDGRFRADVFDRLTVWPVVLPPLRARLPQCYRWPGNVRERENVIERPMMHSSGNALLLDESPWRINGLGIRRADPAVVRAFGRHA